jgi:serine/threonine protein kinase
MTLVTAQLGVPTEIEDELKRLSATYNFDKLSDKGNNGYLFKAYNRVLQRKVAIKFYFWADGYRAHVEPQSLARLTSPSIIEILDASVVGREWALFITPFCEFGDVDRYLEGNRFGVREALRFVAALLDGVSALHQERFVHRDLKPENILVSNSKLPLIADFGSVRILPEGEDVVPGSGHAALYRPPESFHSDRYDKRGDLYQCGVVLYQVLGGRLSYSEVSYLNRDEKARYAELTDHYERSKLVDVAIRNHATRGSLLQMDSLPDIVPETVRRLIRTATAAEPTTSSLLKNSLFGNFFYLENSGAW